MKSSLSSTKALDISRTFGREKLTEDEGSARTGKIIQYTTDEELVLLNSNHTKTSVMRDDHPLSEDPTVH
jgi:hypothetical protein